MAEDGHAGIDAGRLVDMVGNLLRRAIALRHDDDMVVAALDAADAHLLYDIRIKVQLALGQADRSCADRAADVQRQMARAASHDLDDRAALVRLHGIAQLIDALDRSVARGVKADRVVRAHDVVVDRAGHADAGHALAGQRLRAAERTVAAAADQAVDAEILAGVRRLLQALLGQHLLAARGVQHGAAAADDAVYAAGAHLDDIAVDQAAVAAADAQHGDIERGRGTDDRTDQCVHAGCVAAAGEYANSANLFIHSQPPFSVALFFPREKSSYFIITFSSPKRKRNFSKNGTSGWHQNSRFASVVFPVSVG